MKFSELILFLLFLTSIPVQLGKHFWPTLSFVNGIRVDYLSPTLYFSDIVLLFLFVASFSRLKKTLWSLIKKPLFIYSFTVLLIGCFLSLNPYAAFLKLVKLLEFLFLGFYTVKTFSFNFKDKYIYILTLGGLTQCIILFLQFFSQHSLDGVFYYLGERTIGPGSIGAAVFPLNNSLVMRPYGTFPHPNVLAFYLLFPFTYLLFSNGKNKTIKVIAITLLFFGIIFTFSRIVILLSLLILILHFYLKVRRVRKSLLLLCLSFILLFGALLFNRFTASFVSDLTLRNDLLKIGVSEFIKHPFFGVGLNNFFYHEIFYQKDIMPTLLQPVHNIYVLWLVETGILGGIVALILLRKTFKKAIQKIKSKDNFYISTAILFFSALFIGLFFHYLLTLQQGQLLLTISIGLLWTNIRERA